MSRLTPEREAEIRGQYVYDNIHDNNAHKADVHDLLDEIDALRAAPGEALPVTGRSAAGGHVTDRAAVTRYSGTVFESLDQLARWLNVHPDATLVHCATLRYASAPQRYEVLIARPVEPGP